MFRNPFGRKRDVVASEPHSTLGRSDTLPADTGTLSGKMAAQGQAVMTRAKGVYQRNPKLINGIALVAGAALLAGMKKRHPHP